LWLAVKESFLAFSFLFIPIFCFAQQNVNTPKSDSAKSITYTTNSKITAGQTSITGRVTDAATGQPIPFITIVITGTSLGTSTDNNGNYILMFSGHYSHIKFSYIG
jgi:hypothetical protein